MTLLASVTRTALRPKENRVWQCYWCHIHIKRGEKYHEQRYIEDGDILTARGHTECCDAHYRSGIDPEDVGLEPQPRGMTQEEKEGLV